MQKSIFRLAGLSLVAFLISSCGSNPVVYEAAADGDLSRLDSLLETGGNVEEYGFWGTPLDAVTAKYEEDDPELMPLVRRLLEAGANPDGLTYVSQSGVRYGYGPMHRAASRCNRELIDVLLEYGADINKNGGFNDIPLWYAIDRGHLECANYLIDRGANLYQGDTRWGFGNSTILEEIEDQDWDVQAFEARYEQAQIDLALGQERAAEAARLAEIEAQRAAEQAEYEAYLARIDVAWERDASLTPQFRRDKYLIAFSTAMQEAQYQDADVYARLLERNGLGIEDSLYYFWGEALLRIGQPEQSLEKLNTYLMRTGPSGQYYSQALALMLEAESQ